MGEGADPSATKWRHVHKALGRYEVPVSAAQPATLAYRRDRYHDADIVEIADGIHPTITVHAGLEAPFLVTATEASGDFLYKRSLANIRRDRADYYILFAVLSGTLKFLYNGHRSLMAAGDFVFARVNVPYEMTVFPGTDERFCQICISLPTDKVEELDLARIAGVPISRKGRGPSLVQGLIRTLFEHGTTISAPMAHSLLGTILLGVTQMAEGVSQPSPNKVSLRDTRRDAIMTYLDSHCTNPDLRAAMVAAACQMSVRYMSGLLSEKEHSFSGLVRDKRLQRLRSWLGDPALDGEPIAALAYRAGFNSASLCIASFRNKYGYTPRQFRQTREQ